MIHKIKSLYDNGNGLTERKIAKELGLSRNTVSKYLHMPETGTARQLDEIARTKKLDAYRAYIILLLQTYPNLSAVKVMREPMFRPLVGSKRGDADESGPSEAAVVA